MRPSTRRRPRGVPSLVVLLFAAGALAGAPTPASGQSLLERPPNLSGGWVGEPGVVQFNFLHRFSRSGEKILNTPTFLLAAPLPGGLLVGGHYASNSGVAGKSNEFELFGRWKPLAAGGISPVDVAVTGAYNQTAASLDGEVSVGLPAGPLELMAIGRAFQEGIGENDAGWAVGGGAVFRVSPGVSLSADVVSMPDRANDEKLGWGGGLQLRVPSTPHTFSLQVANSRTTTLRGSAQGVSRDETFWGFEFTVPFTLSRYVGGGPPEADAAAPEPTNRVTMTNRLTYTPAVIRIRAGESVTWENTSDLVHTVTADASKAIREESVSLPDGVAPFDSGNLAPGESFTRTFDVPGEYVYFCVPHEAAGMVGRIVVEP